MQRITAQIETVGAGLILMLLLLCCPCPAIAGDNQREDVSQKNSDEKDYYKDTKRGWWWYETEPEKPKEKKKEDRKSEELQQIRELQKRKLPSLKDYTKEQLWSMRSSDFKELLGQFLEKAETSKKEEDVREYYVIQDIARRRALAFTNTTAYVMQKYPELSVNKDYPVAVPGMNALAKQISQEKEGMIRNAQGEFGILYFYSPTCAYCEEQDGILYFFTKKYGWDIKKVDININTRAASKFGVTTPPYIILVQKSDGNSIPISAGVVSMVEIEEKLYRGIRLLKGEITPEEYSIYDFQKGGSFDINMPSYDFNKNGSEK